MEAEALDQTDKSVGTIQEKCVPFRRTIFIVSPDGQAGGGMGRVKDYILNAGNDANQRFILVPLTTRDHCGAFASLWLVLRAILNIWIAAYIGRAALVHVNAGDKGSFLRKGVILLMARAAGIPVVLHLHAVVLEQDYKDGGALRRWLIRVPFYMATTVVVLGERWRRWLTQDLLLNNLKVKVLHNGVTSHLSQAKSVSSASRFEVLFLGNLQERKGVTDLLIALNDVKSKEWHATFAGGGDIECYTALAQRLGLSDHVTFAGWVDRPKARSLLEKAGVLVLPSYDEGLPLVILEALGCGTPVVCTAVGSIPEVLNDGDTALFCKPGDQKMLANCLDLIMRDEKLRQRLSSRGLDLFRRKFSLEAFHRSLFEIYRQQCGVDFVMTKSPVAKERETP